MNTLKLLVPLSLRSLASHKGKTLIVGGILAFGTFLLTLTTTMLHNVERQMEASVTGALIGHMQLVSDDATDQLAFFGPEAQSAQDVGLIEDFDKVREVLEKVPNVQGVVPMGRDIATVAGGNLIDRALEQLRDAVREGRDDEIPGHIARVKQLASLVAEELESRARVSSDVESLEADREVTQRVLSDAFWQEFDADRLATLDWLDSRFAPLQTDGQFLFLLYLGTDLHRFAQAFDKFQVVKGDMVPEGERGLLLSQEYMEKAAKNFIARELDAMKASIELDGRTIATHKPLAEQAARIARQSSRLVYEIGPAAVPQVQQGLREVLGTDEGDVGELITRLLTLDDANFKRRYEAFYEHVAPHIRLYSVLVGETVTLRVFTKSGYARAANLKVYGTFGFKGLEGSLLSSAYNLVDIETFRDLYGLMTPERQAEIDAMRASVGLQDVSADTAIDDLFGDADSLEAEAVAEAPAAAPEPDVQMADVQTADVQTAMASAPAVDAQAYDQARIDQGVVLHAAVMLEDGTKIEETSAAIRAAVEQHKLGLKIVTWQTAAGLIGQLILVMRIVLYAAFVIIFIVALAIINNSMLMATMDRIVEIGTMRAIGAGRQFVLSMVLLETLVLGVLAASLGIAGAAGIISLLNVNGIPAGTNEIMLVLFGGPRLFPELSVTSIVVGIASIAVVSVIATLYPAIIATRVQPVVAMQRRE